MSWKFWKKNPPPPVKEYSEPEFVGSMTEPASERPKPVIKIHDIPANKKDYRKVWDKL